MLSNWDMQPTTVPDATSALRELRLANAQGKPFRLVLSDVHMPEIDGFELTSRIKAADDIDSPVILMLTSGDSPGDIERCRQVGGAAYLMKPVKQSELFDAIVAAFESVDESAEAALPPPPTAEQTGRPLKILLAEDSYVNQRLAVGVLSGWGHVVTVANDGVEAVAASARERFDLVLMDVQMPELDGYQATAQIRERESKTGGHVPIIAMTAHAMKGDREECLAAGMDGYVSKPIRRPELQAAIAASVDVVRPDEAERAAAAARSSNGLDWQHALDVAGGNRKLLGEVLAAFVEEAPLHRDELRQALSTGDAVALARAAHTLKGILHLFGETPAGELAQQMESHGKSGNLSAAADLMEPLRQALDPICEDVQQHVRLQDA
jgi:CheY-like chemotaxis protein/HPt (histidine-containing phosphotransfer) domain-containing protein